MFILAYLEIIRIPINIINLLTLPFLSEILHFAYDPFINRKEIDIVVNEVYFTYLISTLELYSGYVSIRWIRRDT